MRTAIFYYLAQTWTADQHRQAQRDALPLPASAASQIGTPRRRYRVRRLPAAATRRLLTVLGSSR